MTPRLWGKRGRRRAMKLGIDPARLPPGQSPTTKFPVLTVGPNAHVALLWTMTCVAAGRGPAHSLDALLDDDVLVAHTFDDAPRPTAFGRVCPHPDHGGPARLLVPSRYLWKATGRTAACCC